MFWQEKSSYKPYKVSDDVVDAAYRINCRCLPLEHAFALSQAVLGALPWMSEDPRAGVHLIHGAESGNGWMRPDDPDNELLYLSRRTRMTLRLPGNRADDAGALVGARLDVAGYALEIGELSIRPLTTSPTIFARYVADEQDAGEEAFMQVVADQCHTLGVPVRKLLCGKSHTLRTPTREILTRSVMMADLDPEHSVVLQQQGLGPHRILGCGLFIAHKGIAPVISADDD